MAADARGNPIDFKITGGDVHDAKAANGLIDKISDVQHLIGDKGYDSESLSVFLCERSHTINFILRKDTYDRLRQSVTG
jgi:hypothetical protein